jgi:glycerol kinase
MIVAFDQGTTSSRAVLFDADGMVRGIAQKEFPQIYPRAGWVEHDPQALLASQWEVFTEVMGAAGGTSNDLAAVGITNQRETTVVWDRATGEPVCNAIVWQDRRTDRICEQLRADGLESMIRERTGLVIDPYFSGTKIRWILDNIPDARKRAEAGELLFGTVDTWLIWNLTRGRVHATDPSNASRTLLYNIRDLEWDQDLLDALNVPRCMMPEVRESSGDFGEIDFRGIRVPIRGVAGDQQAALFGQACTAPGMAKNTYGTGCFLLMNTGPRLYTSEAGLLSTVAWQMNGTVSYALEGSILVAGAAVQWLRDGLRIIDSAPESETLARAAGDGDDVVVVPAFAGLGAPYWDMYARGAIFGLTRDSGREQIARATLQSLAFQTRDVLDAMQRDTGITLRQLQVDGGACANDFLMQFQADILGVAVERPQLIESTAQGAAYLAGIAAGIWNPDRIRALRKTDRLFKPAMDADRRDALIAQWNEAVRRTMHWLKP